MKLKHSALLARIGEVKALIEGATVDGHVVLSRLPVNVRGLAEIAANGLTAEGPWLNRMIDASWEQLTAADGRGALIGAPVRSATRAAGWGGRNDGCVDSAELEHVMTAQTERLFGHHPVAAYSINRADRVVTNLLLGDDGVANTCEADVSYNLFHMGSVVDDTPQGSRLASEPILLRCPRGGAKIVPLLNNEVEIRLTLGIDGPPTDAGHERVLRGLLNASGLLHLKESSPHSGSALELVLDVKKGQLQVNTSNASEEGGYAYHFSW